MAEDIRCETAGTIWKLWVKEGDAVEDGQELFIMEVMKMEVPYTAPVTGIVAEINIAENDVVEEEQVALVIIE